MTGAKQSCLWAFTLCPICCILYKIIVYICHIQSLTKHFTMHHYIKHWIYLNIFSKPIFQHSSRRRNILPYLSKTYVFKSCEHLFWVMILRTKNVCTNLSWVRIIDLLKTKNVLKTPIHIAYEIHILRPQYNADLFPSLSSIPASVPPQPHPSSGGLTERVLVHLLEVWESLNGFDLHLAGGPTDTPELTTLITTDQWLLLWRLHLPCHYRLETRVWDYVTISKY